MKPHWYLKILSYLYEVPIEKRHSQINGTLEVSLHRGEWKLSTRNAVYSFGRFYTSYKSAFYQLDISNFQAQNLLLLGVVMGSIVQLLANHPTLREITAVDIDPVIMDLAKKYWPDNDNKFKTTFNTSDALDWLEKHDKNQKFDLVLADIFIDDITPERMLTTHFLALLKKVLAPKGMLIYSKINYTEVHQKINEKFDVIFQNEFPTGFTLKAKDNKIYVYRN